MDVRSNSKTGTSINSNAGTPLNMQGNVAEKYSKLKQKMSQATQNMTLETMKENQRYNERVAKTTKEGYNIGLRQGDQSARPSDFGPRSSEPYPSAQPGSYQPIRKIGSQTFNMGNNLPSNVLNSAAGEPYANLPQQVLNAPGTGDQRYAFNGNGNGNVSEGYNNKVSQNSKQGTAVKFLGESSTNDYNVRPPYYPQLSSVNENLKRNPQMDVEGYPYETREGVILPLTPSRAYTEEQLMAAPRNLYLQSIQPNVFSYSDTTTPINNNIGISYTQEQPIRVKDQILTQGQYPYDSAVLYHRIDPQLIRENQPKGRADELPTRSPWSGEYSNYQTASGTVGYEDIYDPRFTSYSDGTRSYADINTGQILYYYSDIDSFRRPNFLLRNKIDVLNFRNPNDSISTEYNREISLDDIKDQVESQFSADEISRREDLMERQMRKTNSQRWQSRIAPLMKNNYANSGMAPKKG